MVKILGLSKAWSYEVDTSESSFKFVCITIVVFGVNHGYMVLNKHIRSYNGELKVPLIEHGLWFSWWCQI